LQVAKVTFFHAVRLLFGSWNPIIRPGGSHLLQQSARLNALHGIFGILVRLGNPMTQLDDPLFLRVAARIVRRVGLENGKRVILELTPEWQNVVGRMYRKEHVLIELTFRPFLAAEIA
jgi:hypothetical protein